MSAPCEASVTPSLLTGESRQWNDLDCEVISPPILNHTSCKVAREANPSTSDVLKLFGRMNTTPDRAPVPVFFLTTATPFDLACLHLAHAASRQTWQWHGRLALQQNDARHQTSIETLALTRNGRLDAMASISCEDHTCHLHRWYVRRCLDASERQTAHALLVRSLALEKNQRTLIEHIRPENSSIPTSAYLQQALWGAIDDLAISWRARAGASFAALDHDDGMIEVRWRLDR